MVPFLSQSKHAVLCFRQGYEDPHWQYPAASYGDDYTYQSYHWQPVAWQSDRGRGLSFGSADEGSLLQKRRQCFLQNGQFFQGLHLSRAFLCPHYWIIGAVLPMQHCPQFAFGKCEQELGALKGVFDPDLHG